MLTLFSLVHSEISFLNYKTQLIQNSVRTANSAHNNSFACLLFASALAASGGAAVGAALLVGGNAGVVNIVPVRGGSAVGAAVLVEETAGDHRLLLGGGGTDAPAAGVGVAIHDDTLEASDDAVLVGGHLAGAHLGVGDGDGLTLGGHEDDHIVALDAGVIHGEAGNHQLGAVADRVDGGVLDDDALVVGEEVLAGDDEAAEGGLVLLILEDPLGVKNVVHGGDVVVLVDDAGAGTAELLHVAADAEEEAEVDAEGTDVSTGLAVGLEDGQVALLIVLNELIAVKGTDTELALDGGDERRALEAGALELLEGGDDALGGDSVVQTEDTDVGLTGVLLGLDEAGGAVDADDEGTSDLGVEGTGVASLLALEDALDPRDNLVGGGVGGLVKVDHTILHVLVERTAEGVETILRLGEVAAADVHVSVVLEEKGPLGDGKGRLIGLVVAGGNDEVIVLLENSNLAGAGHY